MSTTQWGETIGQCRGRGFTCAPTGWGPGKAGVASSVLATALSLTVVAASSTFCVSK